MGMIDNLLKPFQEIARLKHEIKKKDEWVNKKTDEIIKKNRQRLSNE